jgi:hypothetical protein
MRACARKYRAQYPHKLILPYPARLHIVPSVKEARELGLFGDWRSKPFNRKFDGKSP